MTRQIARTAAMTSLWRGLEHKKTTGIIYDPYALQIAKNSQIKWLINLIIICNKITAFIKSLIVKNILLPFMTNMISLRSYLVDLGLIELLELH